MVKVLVKKQLMELGAFFYQSAKKGKRRSKGSLIMYALLMVYVVVAMGWMFYLLADTLCEPLVNAGLGWLYFAIVGLMAIVAGVFGSIFTAYSGLYRAKDNELLLSMPVKPSALLLARMTSIFVMSFDFTLVVMVPSILVYHMKGFGGAASVASQIMVTLLVSLFALVLSCVLGWLMGLISAHLKGSVKRLISIVVTLGLLGGYFYVYTKVYNYLQLILINGDKIGSTVRKALFPVYHMGLACEGKAGSLAIFAGMVIALFALVYLLLSVSFIKIAIAKDTVVKARYEQKTMKAGSQLGALLKKEAKRFTGSTVYLINCGLGTVAFLAGAVMVMVKADYLNQFIEMLNQMMPGADSMIPLALAGMLGLVTAMNDITAPSVSLEGKNIWILQSMLVHAWMVLKAKLMLHVIVTLIPAVICIVSVSVVLGISPVEGVLVGMFELLFIVLGAAVGLAVNLKLPNLNWVNETVVIKQSMAVMIAIFGSWLEVLVLGGLYFLLRNLMTPMAYLALATVIIASVACLLLMWLRKRGTKIFAEL
ncbi:MAG: hypothetical protein MR908_06940 [Firmicutes bacterium]|nr:hypothetical protein [Bacillota bacterium]